MKMKTLNSIIITLALLATTAVFQSCSNDDDNYSNYPNAIVTAKTASDNTFYLQLDEKTTLLPTNITKSPYGDKEVRALVNYTEVENKNASYSKTVKINWIDSILTKPMVQNLGADNDKVYGCDPVELVRDWVNIAEDGYLTLRFRTLWSGVPKSHLVNLVGNVNPNDPYELEFRHNAFGDIAGYYGDGLVAFKLSDLPDTEGKTVKLTIKWKSFSGEKSTTFDYCTSKSTPMNISINGGTHLMSIK